MVDQVKCSGCGQFRPRRLAGTTEQEPCPRCGATALHISASAHLTGTGEITALASLEPGDQSVDWKRRWQDIQVSAAEVLAPITGPMSGDAIQQARRRVKSFYVLAYHLKDSLKVAERQTRIPGKAVENKIDSDPDLALLADLCNLDKHGRPDPRYPPRSRHSPSEGKRAGTYLPGSPPAWQLRLEIKHNGAVLDGLVIVQRSVDAWRRALQGWGLIS